MARKSNKTGVAKGRQASSAEASAGRDGTQAGREQQARRAPQGGGLDARRGRRRHRQLLAGWAHRHGADRRGLDAEGGGRGAGVRQGSRRPRGGTRVIVGLIILAVLVVIFRRLILLIALVAIIAASL
jgi:hypothetical protein